MVNNDLKVQYEATLIGARRQLAMCEDAYKKGVWSSIVRSLEDTIFYMEYGKFPLKDELNEKMNKTRREIYVDSCFYEYNVCDMGEREEGKEISLINHKILTELLKALSKREKLCYILKYQELFSNADIASMLAIEVTSVETYIERAKEKIEQSKKKSIYVFAKGWDS